MSGRVAREASGELRELLLRNQRATEWLEARGINPGVKWEFVEGEPTYLFEILAEYAEFAQSKGQEK
jgi:hypothetical protein